MATKHVREKEYDRLLGVNAELTLGAGTGAVMEIFKRIVGKRKPNKVKQPDFSRETRLLV